jgi:hypothetical protein
LVKRHQGKLKHALVLPLEGIRSWQQAAEDDPFGERGPPPFHPTHFAARFRPHPAIWISDQHAALGSTRPRTATPSRRARTTRAIGISHRRHLHLPLSSLQWRNADRPKSVRPAIILPVQVSGQLVNPGARCGQSTCPRARVHSCLCVRRDSLLPRSHSVRTAYSSALRPLLDASHESFPASRRLYQPTRPLEKPKNSTRGSIARLAPPAAPFKSPLSKVPRPAHPGHSRALPSEALPIGR